MKVASQPVNICTQARNARHRRIISNRKRQDAQLAREFSRTLIVVGMQLLGPLYIRKYEVLCAHLGIGT